MRTIYRDLEALSAAGVPVYAEPGRNGGCQLIDGYRTRLTGLTAKEAEALFMSGVPGPVGELGLGTVLGAAQLKLLAALPKDLADRATVTRQRFHLDAPTWFKSGRNEPHLAAIAAAVWEDQRIADPLPPLRRRRAGTRATRSLRARAEGGYWYLVARRDGEMRTYRVSRVDEVVGLDEHVRATGRLRPRALLGRERGRVRVERARGRSRRCSRPTPGSNRCNAWRTVRGRALRDARAARRRPHPLRVRVRELRRRLPGRAVARCRCRGARARRRCARASPRWPARCTSCYAAAPDAASVVGEVRGDVRHALSRCSRGDVPDSRRARSPGGNFAVDWS